jgi:hypothetical protein
VEWPAWSPDLTQLDFLLWCFMKSRVYDGGGPATRHQLGVAINGAAVGMRSELGPDSGSTEWHARTLIVGISNMWCNNFEISLI